MKRRDIILGGVTLALSAAYAWMTSSVPVSSLADAIGPRGLPRIYATMLAGLALILVVQSQLQPARRKGEGDAIDDVSASTRRQLGALGMLVIGVLYLFIAPWLGYLLSIAGIILATIYYQGGGFSRTAVVIALGGGLFFWLLFVVLMGIAQPPGIFPPSP